MVGQFENCLMPWRTSSSSRTLTVLNSLTLHAFRIWMARPEKAAHQELGAALHEEHDVVFVDDLLDALLRIHD